jgi:hypothetical protein
VPIASKAVAHLALNRYQRFRGLERVKNSIWPGGSKPSAPECSTFVSDFEAFQNYIQHDGLLVIDSLARLAFIDSKGRVVGVKVVRRNVVSGFAIDK